MPLLDLVTVEHLSFAVPSVLFIIRVGESLQKIKKPGCRLGCLVAVAQPANPPTRRETDSMEAEG